MEEMIRNYEELKSESIVMQNPGKQISRDGAQNFSALLK